MLLLVWSDDDIWPSVRYIGFFINLDFDLYWRVFLGDNCSFLERYWRGEDGCCCGIDTTLCYDIM